MRRESGDKEREKEFASFRSPTLTNNKPVSPEAY
jgi:hypothetical protein